MTATVTSLSTLTAEQAELLVGQTIASVDASEYRLTLTLASGDVLEVKGHTFSDCALDVDLSAAESQGSKA